MLAMSFGIMPSDLSRVPLHTQEERRVILQGQYEARIHLVKKFKVSPEKIVLPEY